MKYKREIELNKVKMTLSYVCPKTEKAVNILIEGHQFYSSESPCEMCGSHGSVSITFDCKECGKNHEIEINSW